jgi:hypothetical protein
VKGLTDHRDPRVAKMYQRLAAGRATDAPTTSATPTKTTPATALLPDGRLPPVGAGSKFAYLLGRGLKVAKAVSQKPRTQPGKVAAKAPAETSRASKVTTNSASAKTPVSQFAHLAPDRIPAYGQDAAEAPTADRTGVTAAAVLAAAAKARTPTGTNLPAPTGMAAKVMAAAEKSRTPTSAPPPPTNSLAAAVIAAGKKRRGEI